MGLPFKDTIAILSIVILNGILGYLQASRADPELAADTSLGDYRSDRLRQRIHLVYQGTEITTGRGIDLTLSF